MNQISVLSQIVPIISTSKTMFFRTSHSVNIIEYLREEDIPTVLMVYRSIANRSYHYESRAIRIARTALKQAVELLDKQVDRVYEEIKSRRESVLGRIRGSQYIFDLKPLRDEIKHQMTIVKKRRELLQEAILVCSSESQQGGLIEDDSSSEEDKSVDWDLMTSDL